MDRLVASPCCNPEMELEEVLYRYSSIGFRKFEIFSGGGVRSAFDYHRNPEFYLQLAKQFEMKYYSFHLPRVTSDSSIQHVIEAAQFAAALGVEILLFKAASRELYIRTAGLFLDAIANLPVTPVLQNHAGSALSTLADFREVLHGISDPRMKTLLEVGHFHSVGVTWREGLELLGNSIALVHIKDQVGRQSVPFGQGEIDLADLFQTLDQVGYRGNYVVEMEVKDKENTLIYLEDAYKFSQLHLENIKR